MVVTTVPYEIPQEARQENRIWPLCMAAYLVFFIVCGGVTQPTLKLKMLQSAVASVVFCFAIWQLFGARPRHVGLFAPHLAISTLLLVLLQLLPLPMGIWSRLPGRDFVLESNALLGLQAGFRPFTLSPEGTKGVAIALLPGIAGFFGVLAMQRRHLYFIAIAIAFCGVFGVLLGLAQRGQSSESVLFYFGLYGSPSAVGTFLNRNHFAAQLYSSIPPLVAVAVILSQKLRVSGWLIAVLTLAYAGMIIAGLAVVGSRAGILLAMLTALLTAIMVMHKPNTAPSKGLRSTGAAFSGMIIAFLLLSQVSMVGLLRVVDTDPLSDYRSTIAAVSWETTKNFLPFGSGFGTFVPVYQMHEKPADMISSYVNHAHNDWLELLIEGGLPAAVLLVLFVGWFLYRSFRVWRYKEENVAAILQRACTISIFCLLLHSLTDYPLRTPGLMVFFAMCCAVLAMDPESLTGKRLRSGSRQSDSEARNNRRASSNVTNPVPRRPDHFGSRRPDNAGKKLP